ncbi:MAG: flagellar assembly protein FliW [Gemmatimonas sp.]|uniref:flagellar assembly protein FliW n=1 Tax=Gemmatimonas sp. TaxID=1962908 RepID=UPI00391FBC93|nr:flagellar assembly protein FliW [Gemmatimonadota bacterium]
MNSIAMDAVSAHAVPDDVAIDVQFPMPLWGIPHARTYALRPASREGVWWLQSHEEPVTTFVLADPFVVEPSYAIDLGEKEKASLRATSADDVIALVILTLPAGPVQPVTGNFRAPVVINLRAGLGLQVVNRDESQHLTRPVSLGAYPLRHDGMAAPATDG